MRLLIAVLCFMLVGCYNAADEPCIIPELPKRNTTIHHLKSFVVGTTPSLIESDVVVVGRIISSDRDGNFYRTIVVDDGTGAVEVMMGTSLLFGNYPEGLMVALRLEGCYAAYQRGVLAVGAHAAEGNEAYGVGYLVSRQAIDRVVVRSTDVAVQQPHRRSIAELRREDCGGLVRIDGVHLVASTAIDTLAGETLHDACWRGYALFKSGEGDSVAVYTRDYARYAESVIPLEEVSLTGVLEWAKYSGGRECYHIKMRYEEDCVVH